MYAMYETIVDPLFIWEEQGTYLNSPMELFGRRVRKLRVQKHMSQQQLASAAGLHPNYISDLERGKRNVSLQVILKLAEALHVEAAQLFQK